MHYVNTGAYLARRGVLDLDRYLELLRFARRNPDVFLGGDHGNFNFMVFSGADAGTVRVDQRELQITTGDNTYEEVSRCFSLEDRPRVAGFPAILHWAGSPKPSVREGARDHFGPMTFFRREFRAALCGRPWRLVDDLWLRFEDFACADFRGSNLRGRTTRWRRRSGYVYRELKRTVRARVPDRIVWRIRQRPRDRGAR